MGRFQQMTVGNQAIIQVQGSFRAPKEAAEGGKRQLRAAGIGTKKPRDKLEGLIEVGVRGTCSMQGEIPQTANGKEVSVSLASPQGCFYRFFSFVIFGKRGVQESSVFSHKQEKHSVDDAQDLSV
jgi:hypothetical protein